MIRFSPLQRFNQVLLAFLLFFSILYLARPFLIPLAIGGLFAMLLVPVCHKLEKWGVSRTLAALISVLAVIIILVGLLVVLINQITNLTNDLPQLGQELSAKLDKAHDFINSEFNLSREQQLDYIRNELALSVQQLIGYFKRVLMFSGTILMKFILVMILTTIFLLYREKLKQFVYRVAGNTKTDEDEDLVIVGAKGSSNPSTIINEIAEVANSYIAGVFLVVLILAVVNTVGLLIIGIEHAIFFGLLAGLLNIIPYVGSISGSLIPVAFALLTEESWWPPLIIGIFFLVVQLTESYFLTPNITGSKVRLNPMIIIVGLLLGGFLWGIVGMILFIPYMGIAKVIFDHVEHLQPYGYLFGNEKSNGS